jgi:formylglycine-generating enzyme required for sulfatase activity
MFATRTIPDIAIRMKSPRITVCSVAVAAWLAMTEARPDDAGSAPSRAADPMRGKDPGEVRDDNGLQLKLVWCPPGAFTMESVEVVTERHSAQSDELDDEIVGARKKSERKVQKSTIIRPVKVALLKGYWLGKYEVTQSEWKRVMESEPWKGQEFTKEGADYPATFVSWNDAVHFCRKLTERERLAGRLSSGWEYTIPTEAQWERACRARTQTRFSFGDDDSKLREYAWYNDGDLDPDEAYAHRVGQKKPNPWGLCDMHGNVWEWCRDAHTPKLPGGRDPEVKADEKTGDSGRVYRGGSWYSVAAGCRSAYRDWSQPGNRYSYFGFRVALCVVR